MADGTDKPVESLRIGSEVWNPLTRKPARAVDVVRGPENKNLWEVLAGEMSVIVTEDHPFQTKRGWKQARELVKDDLLLGDGSDKKVNSVRRLAMRADQIVWNLELEGDDVRSTFCLGQRDSHRRPENSEKTERRA